MNKYGRRLYEKTNSSRSRFAEKADSGDAALHEPFNVRFNQQRTWVVQRKRSLLTHYGHRHGFPCAAARSARLYAPASGAFVLLRKQFDHFQDFAGCG